MKQLIEVIKIVADKYMNDVNLILMNDRLVLEYLRFRNEDDFDVYKTIEIFEFDNKLKLVFMPERVERIIEVNEIHDIILVLEKQNKAKEHTQEEIEYIKKKYIVGTKVKLVKMYDIINTVPPNTIGTIIRVDDIGTLHIDWQNGSTLGLVVGTDEFEIIKGDF